MTGMTIKRYSSHRLKWQAVVCIFVSLMGLRMLAEETLCATVKIRIEQDLTLNRQAFDAELSINNALPDIPLTEFDVAIKFYDDDMNVVMASSDPSSSNALFFVQDPIVSGIDQLPGGTVAASSSAAIRWLIVPTLDAAADTTLLDDASGALFYVGAKLTYKIAGVDYETEVSPDAIFVRPMPELRLDYFLPGEVYGDNLLTEDEQEPVVPFSLGLRVENVGQGWARDVTIDSGLPKIVANTQQLAVAYSIEGCEVNGSVHPDTLQVELGDLPPEDGTALARWIMTCSYSGEFTNFNAHLSHSDELGGMLTSLIPETNIVTHLLRHDVLVDIGGRDAVRDFLTTDDIAYESEGGSFAVSNMSASSIVAPADAEQYALRFGSAVEGAIYVCVTNPASENLVVSYVMRSDGKVLHDANAWVTTPYDDADSRFVNIFDCGVSNHTYLIAYERAPETNRPPVLDFIGNQTAYPGTPIVFAVQSSDPDGAIPTLEAAPLPAGAKFIDHADGTGLFSWTPAVGQEAAYRVLFVASDGELEASERMSVSIAAYVGSGPAWWAARGVWDVDSASSNDFAVANQGQLKWIARCAAEELDASLDGGSGSTIWQRVTGVPSGGDYSVVNVGQLKAMAAPFYQRMGKPLPWADATNINDYAIVNIGQLKSLFSFDPQGE